LREVDAGQASDGLWEDAVGRCRGWEGSFCSKQVKALSFSSLVSVEEAHVKSLIRF